MRPFFVFAECTCVKPGTLAIQALFQKTFDGEFIHFDMRCMHCNQECLIKEPFEDYDSVASAEQEVMDWLASDKSEDYLRLALTGKTYSIPPEWKGDNLEQ